MLRVCWLREARSDSICLKCVTCYVNTVARLQSLVAPANCGSPAKAGTIETLVSTGDYKTWIPHSKVTVAPSSIRSNAIITPHTALQLVQENRKDYKGTGRVWIAIEN